MEPVQGSAGHLVTDRLSRYEELLTEYLGDQPGCRIQRMAPCPRRDNHPRIGRLISTDEPLRANFLAADGIRKFSTMHLPVEPSPQRTINRKLPRFNSIVLQRLVA